MTQSDIFGSSSSTANWFLWRDCSLPRAWWDRPLPCDQRAHPARVLRHPLHPQRSRKVHREYAWSGGWSATVSSSTCSGTTSLRPPQVSTCVSCTGRSTFAAHWSRERVCSGVSDYRGLCSTHPSCMAPRKGHTARLLGHARPYNVPVSHRTEQDRQGAQFLHALLPDQQGCDILRKKCIEAHLRLPSELCPRIQHQRQDSTDSLSRQSSPPEHEQPAQAIATCRSSSAIGDRSLAQVETQQRRPQEGAPQHEDIEDELSFWWRERCLRIFAPHAQSHPKLQFALQSRRPDTRKHGCRTWRHQSSERCCHSVRARFPTPRSLTRLAVVRARAALENQSNPMALRRSHPWRSRQTLRPRKSQTPAAGFLSHHDGFTKEERIDFGKRDKAATAPPPCVSEANKPSKPTRQRNDS